MAGCGLLTWFQPSLRELVVHSPEWATGSHIFQAFGPVAAFFQAASGPLSKVDHWLAPFPGFRPGFRPLTGSRLFRAFVPVSATSRGASGPLARTFSRLLTRFRPSPGQLVVHSTEWTTGSRLFGASVSVFAFSQLLPPHTTQKPGLGPGVTIPKIA